MAAPFRASSRRSGLLTPSERRRLRTLLVAAEDVRTYRRLLAVHERALGRSAAEVAACPRPGEGVGVEAVGLAPTCLQVLGQVHAARPVAPHQVDASSGTGLAAFAAGTGCESLGEAPDGRGWLARPQLLGAKSRHQIGKIIECAAMARVLGVQHVFDDMVC